MKHFRRFNTLLLWFYVTICFGAAGLRTYEEHKAARGIMPGLSHVEQWFMKLGGWLWEGAGTSDPVLLWILRLITIALWVVFTPGWFAANLVLVVLFMGIALMQILLSGAWRLATVSPTGGVVVTLAGAAIVFGIIKAVLASAARERLRAKLASCPACGADKSQIDIYDRQYHSYPSTRTETRRRTHYNTEGKETGYTEYDVDVADEGISETLHKRCKKCSHTWTTRD